jgi:hypothetical protein
MVTPAVQPIPRIVHQTWRDDRIPLALAPWQQSWREHHPGWQYRLWTDLAVHELIQRDYRWFLPVYDGYAEHAKRVGAARYFIVHRHGGVHADMDLESVRPIDELLSGREVVLGLEPHAHAALPLARRQGLTRIVGSAFLASPPGHPFWDHVFMMLVASHRRPSPEDATGPFFLTRALELYRQPGRVFLTPPELLYPITSQEGRDGLLDDPAERARVSAQAFAIQRWSGADLRADTTEAEESRDVEAAPARFVLFDRGKVRLTATFDLEAQGRADEVVGPLVRLGPAISSLPQSGEEGAGAPLLSCMMVTRRRARLARRAIDCFRAQTYPEKELIIIDDDDDDTLARHVEGLADPRIVHVRLPPGNTPLGELRNLAVDRSRGAFVCQWDDDDLSHTRRLSLQMSARASLDADACFLARHQLLWLDRPRLAISNRRVWEGSMICARDRMPRYQALRRGEDTPVVHELLEHRRVVVLDAPELYTYVFHGTNTFQESHFETMWSAASERCEGAGYASRVEAILRSLPAGVARDLAAELGVLLPARELAPADVSAERRA